MAESRIIKKYPNRRLYDTAISSYITLADVKRLVTDNVSFTIQDAKTGEDLTRSVLLQIIMEQEERGEPIFSDHVLEQMIRFYGGAFQGMLGNYLDTSFKAFSEQQDKITQQMPNPLSYMTDMAERNLSLWKDMQDSFFKKTAGIKKPSDEENDDGEKK